ncbi:MAG: MotA/TolQ/ExbB proton channel family protein [Bacteroidales bacterium]|nr:MotA/TolQ/ExbB proton channel family protein [Bacteroidales bacterium]
MNQITAVLYWISTGLMVPVIVFLLYFFVNALWQIGRFYGLYIQRKRLHRQLNVSLDEMPLAEWLSRTAALPETGSVLCRYIGLLQAAAGDAALQEKRLGDYEIEADRELGKSRLLVKIGPILGLMGTLIPMGPALLGLATGDVASMASNMQVAFATTVVGLIIGAVGFITLQVRQRWVADELNLLEYVAEKLKGGLA